MNHRKRQAVDELLPTTRPAKIPRSNHAYLQSASDHAALLPPTLGSRWVQLSDDILTLVGDTGGAMINTVLQKAEGILQNVWDVLTGSRRTEEDESPTTEQLAVVSPQSSSSSVACISPPNPHPSLPAEVPPPPRRRQPSSQNAVASSSKQPEERSESSRAKVPSTGLLTPSSSQTSSGSSSTSFLGLYPNVSSNQRAFAALRAANERERGPARKQKPTRRHIYAERVRSHEIMPL